MLGNIVYINDNVAHIEIPAGTQLGKHNEYAYNIWSDKKKILGEVEDISKDLIKVAF